MSGPLSDAVVADLTRAAHLDIIRADVEQAAREIAHAGNPPAGHVWAYDSPEHGPRATLALARNRLVAVTPAADQHSHYGPCTLTSVRTGAALARGSKAAARRACAALAGCSRLVRAVERCEPLAMATMRARLVAHGLVVLS